MSIIAGEPGTLSSYPDGFKLNTRNFISESTTSFIVLTSTSSSSTPTSTYTNYDHEPRIIQHTLTYSLTLIPVEMSPRNDAYLSLCLAQAELSPLHYRHGSIIVRGGKIIGQGFNTYQPGFDGGALRTGVIAAGPFDGGAIAELKQRLASKPKFKSKHQQQQRQQQQQHNQPDAGARQARSNTPLSMHSEMMAIRSALSLSSGAQSSQTSARAAKCWEKPCFKSSTDAKKRKARARGLKAYAAAVCAEAEAIATTDALASSGGDSLARPGAAGQCPQRAQCVEENGARRGAQAGNRWWVQPGQGRERWPSWQLQDLPGRAAQRQSGHLICT